MELSTEEPLNELYTSLWMKGHIDVRIYHTLIILIDKLLNTK